MQLDPRKLEVLAAIVETFIKTGEPVGSKLIAQILDNRVSSATVRNDMAALFEMGLLEQPHTSAGRVPSHLGYRVYIDRLMHCQPLTQEEKAEIDALFNVRDPDPDKLLEDAAQSLADYTNCAAVSTTITPKTVRVSRIDVIPAGYSTVVILVIASNGVIKNKVCRVNFNVTPENMDFFNKFANSRFDGRSVDEISTMFISSVAVALGEYTRLFTPILTAIYELCKQINDGQFYTVGSTNLLGYREFEQIAHELLNFLNRKDEMLAMITSGEDGIQVTIGRENPHAELSGTAILVSKYKIGEFGDGAIGLIGPLRLDYARIIPHLEYFSETLGKLLSETYEKE